MRDMTQAEIIGGSLLAGFVIWLLMTNRLQAYWALLTGGGTSAAQAQTNAASSSAPPVTSTTAPNAGTSAGNVASFVPGSVQQFGNVFMWNDAITGAPMFSSTPPVGFPPVTQTPQTTTQPTTGQ